MPSDYSPQTWNDNDPATPVDSERLGVIETGLENHTHPDLVPPAPSGPTIVHNEALWQSNGLIVTDQGVDHQAVWASTLINDNDGTNNNDTSGMTNNGDHLTVTPAGLYAITASLRVINETGTGPFVVYLQLWTSRFNWPVQRKAEGDFDSQFEASFTTYLPDASDVWAVFAQQTYHPEQDLMCTAQLHITQLA